MHILDAPWIGTLVGAAVLAAIVASLCLAHKLEKLGVLKNYSRGLGRGLLEVETMLRPTRQYVRRAKEERKEGIDGQGELPGKAKASGALPDH